MYCFGDTDCEKVIEELEVAIEEYEKANNFLYHEPPRITPKQFKIIDRELKRLKAEVIKLQLDLQDLTASNLKKM